MVAGPEIDASFHLASDGTPDMYKATGHHEMGAQRDRNVQPERREGTWASDEEHGSADANGPTFYVWNVDGWIQPWLVPAALRNGGFDCAEAGRRGEGREGRRGQLRRAQARRLRAQRVRPVAVLHVVRAGWHVVRQRDARSSTVQEGRRCDHGCGREEGPGPDAGARRRHRPYHRASPAARGLRVYPRARARCRQWRVDCGSDRARRRRQDPSGRPEGPRCRSAPRRSISRARR